MVKAMITAYSARDLCEGEEPLALINPPSGGSATTPAEATFCMDIGCCVRCGKDHEQIEVRPLANAADEWMHWATCPETGEPILVRITVAKYSL